MASYDPQRLRDIYDRTCGRCHICGKRLSLLNYGSAGAKGAWQVEHSVPRARGGTSHLNNLYPACIGCNNDKGTFTSRTARTWCGRNRAPLSRDRRAKAKQGNAWVGAVAGGLLGALAGPLGIAAGAALGAKVAHSLEPRG